ncbi:hypothetical protein EGI31_25115 [Lacihabitans soyangensis]|uniref:Uncharacterized protein n=1 Tax=Lacihabitans soyangensis TaxID=869394 RepID=A0AAE3H7B7_9BACT|nr:hypothetical protein [Lacihabitans soyangensis]
MDSFGIVLAAMFLVFFLYFLSKILSSGVILLKKSISASYTLPAYYILEILPNQISVFFFLIGIVLDT